MLKATKNKIYRPIRYIKFKNVTYRFRGGEKLGITPILFWDKTEYENLIQMGFEKYIIEAEGKFKTENIKAVTLNSIDRFLSNYLGALWKI